MVADAALPVDLAVLVVLDHSGTTGGQELLSYRDVNVATRTLAAQLSITLEDAFARLRAHAFATDRSLLEVAPMHRRDASSLTGCWGQRDLGPHGLGVG